MKHYPFFPIALLIALVFEVSARYLPLPTLKIDVLWLGVLFLGFYVPAVVGGPGAFALGFVQETLGAPFHGVLPLAYLIVYFFLRLTHQNLFFQRRPSQVVWVALLSLAYRGLETGLLVWQGYEVPDGWERLVAWALVEGFLSLAIFPLFSLGSKNEALSKKAQRWYMT